MNPPDTGSLPRPLTARLADLWATAGGLAGAMHYDAADLPDDVPKRPAHDPFAYERGPLDVSRVPLASENARYRTERIAYPAHDTQDPANRISGGLLRVPESPTRGFVIVLPILGGDYAASDMFARHLCERGYATLRFDRKDAVFEADKDFAHIAQVFAGFVVDVRRSLDWAEDEGLAQPGTAGVVGISMGSFVATLVAATDPRISASVLALGGGNMGDLLHHARSEDEINTFLSGYEARGYDRARIDAEGLRDLREVEPLAHAAALGGRKTLLVHARFDAVIPYKNGTALWEAAGRPPRITLLTGHYSAALLVPYLQRATARHFDAHLTAAS